MYKFIIPGKPIQKKRHRHKRIGHRVISYSEQGQQEESIKIAIMAQFRELGFVKLLKDPLGVKIDFYTEIPKSYSKKKRAEHIGKPDPRKPDLDNYIKFYLDVMNALVYKDDSIITSIQCTKTFSEEPRTEIEVFLL